MRTTVNIDDALLEQAKVVAARTHRSLGEVVNDALRVALAAPAARPARVRLETDGGSGLQPGIDLGDKEAMAELLGDNRPADAPR